MKASFTIFEMQINSIASGKIMYIDEVDPLDSTKEVVVQKIIDYVKCVPMSKDIQIHFTDGTVCMSNTYEPFDFEVNKKLQWKKANKRQIAASKKNL